MRRTRMAAVLTLLASLPLAGGCKGGEDPPAESTRGESLDGLTPEQIRQQAEPMSPERAEELGIIDTTIHLEQLTSPEDSLLMRDSGQAVARDTTS